MHGDALQDERRLRRGLLVAGLAVLLLLCVAAVLALGPEWARVQQDFAALGLGDAGERPGIVEVAACDGETDRCMTCHLGAERSSPSSDAVPQPFAPHTMPLADHPTHVFGCSSCHGGTPRALTAEAAHAIVGTGARDPRMVQPYVQAGCARCHVPGAVAGMEGVVRGADLYLRLGCAMCHSLSGGGRGGWDYGPDLRAIGRPSIEHLRASLLEPTADFAQSTMPSYRSSLEPAPEALDDLLVYLLALALPSTAECSVPDAGTVQATAPCASCHAGEQGRAGGRFAHSCAYLNDRRDELRCSGCHDDAIPTASAEGGHCPLVKRHRGACAGCHLGAGQ